MNNLEKFNALEENHSKKITLEHARLMEKIEELPPGTEISPAVKNKRASLEDKLQRKLYSLLIGDILPIIPAIAKVIEKKALITFNFDVISELNVLIDRFKINAVTKKEAWKKAREKAEAYPGQVRLKIS